MSDKEKDVSRKNTGGQPLEDRALKGAVRLFGEELMPLLGIEGKVRRIAPTEERETELFGAAGASADSADEREDVSAGTNYKRISSFKRREKLLGKN